MIEKYDKELLLRMYSRMQMARRFEEEVNLLFLKGELPGTLHLYVGQEAVAVGVCSALRRDDFITSTHRPHGHAVAKGVPTRALMAELYARTTGCCGGYGGSMHMGDLSLGMVPAIAIVAGGIPVAAGIGLAFKKMKTDRVVGCFFGDGATNEGAFHEGINMAAIWDLPVVLVCENNLYGASTHVSRVCRLDHLAERAANYCIPGVTVDGMDVLAVYEATQEAVKRAREGKGPTLIECQTYRYLGHSRTDPGAYRPADEVAAWKARDAIQQLRNLMLKEQIANVDELDGVVAAVEAELQDAIEFARQSPRHKPEDALLNVFAGQEGE